MKLIVVSSIGDGYTFICEDTRPVEYESAEKFIVDFENIIMDKKEVNHTNDEFTLGGSTFFISNYKEWLYEERKWYYSLPEVLTVDEWFDRYMV